MSNLKSEYIRMVTQERMIKITNQLSYVIKRYLMRQVGLKNKLMRIKILNQMINVLSLL